MLVRWGSLVYKEYQAADTINFISFNIFTFKDLKSKIFLTFDNKVTGIDSKLNLYMQKI